MAYSPTGGGATPGGTSGQLQYNNAGVMGGVAGSTVDGSGNITTTQQITLNGPSLKQKDVAANTGSAYTIDPANGKSFGLTMNAATPVITLAANPSATTEQELMVDLIQDGTGGRVPSFPNVTWAAGAPPTILSTAGATTYVSLKGTSRGWIGFYLMQATDAIVAGSAIINGLTFQNGGLQQIVRVVTAAGAVTVTSADNIVIVNKTVGAATTVNFPAGVLNTVFTVKDGKGDAASNNITVTPAAGNIDGSGTYVISTNFGAGKFVYNGTQWNVI